MMPDNIFGFGFCQKICSVLDDARQSLLFYIMPDNPFCLWLCLNIYCFGWCPVLDESRRFVLFMNDARHSVVFWIMCSVVDYSRYSVLSWMMPSNLFFFCTLPDNLFLLGDARWSVLFWIMPSNPFCFELCQTISSAFGFCQTICSV